MQLQLKRISSFFIVIAIIISVLGFYNCEYTTSIFANDTPSTETSQAILDENETKKENETTSQTKPISNVNLTVVIPEKEIPEETKEIKPTEAPKPIEPVKPAPVIPKVYPVNVVETEENGLRQIVKTYELSEQESPADIPRESFDLNGWHYEMSDVTKKETASGDVREHKKTIELATETNNMEAIIKLLAPTIEHTTEDGYQGVLTLDIKSIVVETAKTKKSTFPITAIREYPNLSSNDASFVPKTISDNGRTLALSNVTWKTATATTTDYNQLPNSYTAVVTYTTTGSKTVVTGYTTRADYNGTLSKLIKGKTIYSAIFQGSKIKPKLLPMIEQEILSTGIVSKDIENVEEIENTNLGEEIKQIENNNLNNGTEKIENDSSNNGTNPIISVFCIIFLFAVVTVSVINDIYISSQYKKLILKKEEAKQENKITEEIIKEVSSKEEMTEKDETVEDESDKKGAIK